MIGIHIYGTAAPKYSFVVSQIDTCPLLGCNTHYTHTLLPGLVQEGDPALVLFLSALHLSFFLVLFLVSGEDEKLNIMGSRSYHPIRFWRHSQT